jgi:ribosomal protein L23
LKNYRYTFVLAQEDFKKEHIKSEEFGDFFEAVLQKVSTTNNEEKIKRSFWFFGFQ